MEFSTMALTISGVIFGALTSYFASKHFYKKGIKKKSLIPFVQFWTSLFSDLDKDIKAELIINYKSKKVKDLTQVQFVIANNGELPIKDIIKPLKLNLPKENTILSVNIIHIEPIGRIVNYNIIDSNIIEFDIPLLNSGEFFVVKLLLEGVLVNNKKEDNESYLNSIFKFGITVDDLPPKLKVYNLPFSYYDKEGIKKYDWTPLWIGLVSIFLFVIIVSTIFAFKNFPNHLYLFSLSDFFSWENFGYYNFCILSLALVGFIFLIISIIGFIGSIYDIQNNDKPKFIVPKELRKKYIRAEIID